MVPFIFILVNFLIFIGAQEFGFKINIFGANCAIELVQN